MRLTSYLMISKTTKTMNGGNQYTYYDINVNRLYYADCKSDKTGYLQISIRDNQSIDPVK